MGSTGLRSVSQPSLSMGAHLSRPHTMHDHLPSVAPAADPGVGGGLPAVGTLPSGLPHLPRVAASMQAETSQQAGQTTSPVQAFTVFIPNLRCPL